MPGMSLADKALDDGASGPSPSSPLLEPAEPKYPVVGSRSGRKPSERLRRPRLRSPLHAHGNDKKHTNDKAQDNERNLEDVHSHDIHKKQQRNHRGKHQQPNQEQTIDHDRPKTRSIVSMCISCLHLPSLCLLPGQFLDGCSRFSRLHPRTAETQLTSLSAHSRSRLQALGTEIVKNIMVVLHVRCSDELPRYLPTLVTQPRVFVHVVDLCTGKPIQPVARSPRASIRAGLVNAFQWNTAHRFQQTLLHLVSPNVLILIEILEPQRTLQHRITSREIRQLDDGRRFQRLQNDNQSPPRGLSAFQDDSTDPEDSSKYHRIAWCFFRPVSANGSIMLPALVPQDVNGENTSLQLQFFEYQSLNWLDQRQATKQWGYKHQKSNTKARNGHHSGGESAAETIPSVFLQFQNRSRVPVPSSLHIDMTPALATTVPAPEESRASAPSTLSSPTHGDAKLNLPDEAGGNESKPTVSVGQSTETPSNDDEILNQRKKEDEPVVMDPFDPLLVCRRSATEACIVPRRMLHRLLTGRQGCSSLSFSADGLFLAAAIHHISTTTSEWYVHIYRVNSGAVWQVCGGHQNMIHSIEWQGASHLVAASSDGTVQLWDLCETATPVMSIQRARCVWQHIPAPNCVFSAIFHPICKDYVVSAASDGCIRVWKIQDSSQSCDQHKDFHFVTAPTPTIQWCASTSAAHSIQIERKSGRLFCGDANGDITVWMPTNDPAVTATPETLTRLPSRFECVKTIASGQSSVSSIRLHPRKQRLLVLTQPHGALLQYELRSFLLLQKSSGASSVLCRNQLVHAGYSADGRFVVSGSEDGVPRIAESLARRSEDSPSRLWDSSHSVWGQHFFRGHPILEIAWSPTAHIVAMGSYGGSHPIVVLAARRTDQPSHLHELHDFLENQQLADHARVAPLPGMARVGGEVPWGKPPVHSPNRGDRVRRTHNSSIPSTADTMRNHSSAFQSDDQLENDDRVQRTLERRRLRLQARMAREAAAATGERDAQTISDPDSTT